MRTYALPLVAAAAVLAGCGGADAVEGSSEAHVESSECRTVAGDLLDDAEQAVDADGQDAIDRHRASVDAEAVEGCTDATRDALAVVEHELDGLSVTAGACETVRGIDEHADCPDLTSAVKVADKAIDDARTLVGATA